jgi:transposase
MEVKLECTNHITKREFSGKRIKRGLYQNKSGQLINADLNAALNIIRKSNPDALWIGNSSLNTPKRAYLFS